MRKRTKILIGFFSAFIITIVITSVSFLYYRTTPHYLLRHEHAADVTLDNGNVVRFIRQSKGTPNGIIWYDELDVYKIVKLCSDELVIPEKVGGFPVTAFGKLTSVEMFLDVDVMQVKRMTIPDTMKEISSCGQLWELKYLDIGNSTADGINSLETYNLKELKVSKDNTRYTVDGGCLIENESEKLILRFGNAPISEKVNTIGTSSIKVTDCLVIPDNIEKIEQHAINIANENAVVFIPNTVTEIDMCGIVGIPYSKIYCESPQKAIAWNDMWNDIYLNEIGISELDIEWNYTLEEFKELEN